MYASVTTASVQPGKMEEHINTWRESVKPLVESFPGFKNIYALTNPETNRGMTIAFYETKADAERTQSSGDYKKAVEMMAGTIVMGSIVREGYEVSIQV